ncbi:TolB family protein [Spongiimicrobium sp. 3-5]|uniref:TolB family protein n=1 Tax=Spongiimicrobium sp. 3-5 TaxID=3332596 RepID=UPI00397FB440
MLKNFKFLVLLFFSFFSSYAIQNNKGNKSASKAYLEQKRPSKTPEIFAPNLISKKGEYEFGSVFNRDATEFFYGVAINGKEEIRYSKLVGKKWSKPEVILTHKQYGYNDPFLSPDENRLYFISRRALDGLGKSKDYDIWYVERNNNQWSDPINAGPNINSSGNEYYVSFTNDGTMYFSSNKKGSNFDIYSSKFLDGEFQKAIQLSDSINTSAYEADVFIAQDESYIIFCATRKDGLGRGDLYISFKNTDGTWSKSVNMGDRINTKNHELCPFVSKDGKYLFYTSNQDIYWVSADILENYRKKSN